MMFILEKMFKAFQGWNIVFSLRLAAGNCTCDAVFLSFLAALPSICEAQKQVKRVFGLWTFRAAAQNTHVGLVVQRRFSRCVLPDVSSVCFTSSVLNLGQTFRDFITSSFHRF